MKEVFEVKLENGICIEPNEKAVISWIENLQTGESVSVRKTEMSQEEYDRLPEYEP